VFFFYTTILYFSEFHACLNKTSTTLGTTHTQTQTNNTVKRYRAVSTEQ